jgi:vitamin B12/bleomycin/antimicrobial peptide transport system ATP-binding/permease protein
LMLASGAFLQVQSSLRWFVDNFSTIADWRATLLRVAVFRRAVIDSDVMHDTKSRIGYESGKTQDFDIANLRISAPAGCCMLKETQVQIRAGERALIAAETGTDKTLLFRALAGLWPWGSGSIIRPADGEILYMPRTPYMPPGNLREILAYPTGKQHFETKGFADALTRVGLERLVPDIDAQKRWEHELNDDEQQALAFARVILHQPAWLLIDEVLDSLDETTMTRVAANMKEDLAKTGVIYIGRNDSQKLFPKVLHLIKDPKAKNLPVPAAALAASTANA